MWAVVLLSLVLTVRATDTNNDTQLEEKLHVARGKLLVSEELTCVMCLKGQFTTKYPSSDL